VQQVLDFEKAVWKYRTTDAQGQGQPLFDPNKGEGLNWRTGSNGTILWSFSVELKRSEVQ
jgi:hypothetical protein